MKYIRQDISHYSHFDDLLPWVLHCLTSGTQCDAWWTTRCSSFHLLSGLQIMTYSPQSFRRYPCEYPLLPQSIYIYIYVSVTAFWRILLTRFIFSIFYIFGTRISSGKEIDIYFRTPYTKHIVTYYEGESWSRFLLL